MPYICSDPETYANKPGGDYADKQVGTGQCVAFVQACAKVPETNRWRPGLKVQCVSNFAIKPGTAIATFFNGRYPNQESGNHAAIYIRHTASAIYVWDQWAHDKNRIGVHKRSIYFRGGTGDAVNDGDNYYVIEAYHVVG